MMYAICKELNIKFYAIFRPVLVMKKSFSDKDKEQLQYRFPTLNANAINDSIQKKTFTLIGDKLKEKQIPYIKDFTNIFDDINEIIYRDGIHFFDLGNELMAKQIFKLIETDL